MKELRFSSKKEAMFYLFDIFVKRIRCAGKLEDVLAESKKAVENSMRVRQEMKDLQKQYDDLMQEYEKLRKDIADMDKEGLKQASMNFGSFDNAIQYLSDITNSKIIIQEDEDATLKFSSECEALQYLADISNSTIKIAYDIDDYDYDDSDARAEIMKEVYKNWEDKDFLNTYVPKEDIKKALEATLKEFNIEGDVEIKKLFLEDEYIGVDYVISGTPSESIDKETLEKISKELLKNLSLDEVTLTKVDVGETYKGELSLYIHVGNIEALFDEYKDDEFLNISEEAADQAAYQKDPYAYYGVSKSDFR